MAIAIPFHLLFIEITILFPNRIVILRTKRLLSLYSSTPFIFRLLLLFYFAPSS